MKAVILSLCLLSLALATPSVGTAESFEQAAAEVREDLDAAQKERATVEREIAEEKAALASRLEAAAKRVEQLKQSLAMEQSRLEEATAQKAALVSENEKYRSETASAQAAFGEFARKISGLLEARMDRNTGGNGLAAMAGKIDQGLFVGPEDLERLLAAGFHNIESSMSVVREKGRVIDREGREVAADILYLGSLTALYERDGRVGYLISPGSSERLLMAGDPGWRVRRNLEPFLDGREHALYVDLSGGASIRRLSRGSDLLDRLMAGGALVWPILLAGALALVLILERLIFLLRARFRDDRLVDRVAGLLAKGRYETASAIVAATAGRPTGAVLKAGLDAMGQSRENVENAFLEEILHQTPRLERSLTTLRALAASAPLLGLLGTVTGMIKTFDVITIHGANDPRFMSGGISEALITTQLGLAVAIPVMLAVSLLARSARNLASDMEEKALTLTAAILNAGDDR